MSRKIAPDRQSKRAGADPAQRVSGAPCSVKKLRAPVNLSPADGTVALHRHDVASPMMGPRPPETPFPAALEIADIEPQAALRIGLEEALRKGSRGGLGCGLVLCC